jgi:lysophospholipase L1-like esterase
MASLRVIRAVFVLVGLLLSVTVCEVALRWSGYTYTPLRIQTIENLNEWRYYHAFRDEHFEYDPYLIWRPRKNVTPFNSSSYRGGELNTPKPSGEFRIFAIGDSNTLGWLGEGDFNWPAYLQDRLARERFGVVVVNAGVYGYSSFQGLRQLNQALPLQPDMALVSFGWNDGLRVTVSDTEFVDRGIRAWRLDEALMPWRTGQVLLAAYDGFASRPAGLIPRVSVEEYRDNLVRMIALAHEHGIQIVLLTRPFKPGSFEQSYNLTVLEVSKATRIPVVDVYAYFANRPELFKDDSHFTEAGHILMAGLIQDRIRPLLPHRHQKSLPSH